MLGVDGLDAFKEKEWRNLPEFHLLSKFLILPNSLNIFHYHFFYWDHSSYHLLPSSCSGENLFSTHIITVNSTQQVFEGY